MCAGNLATPSRQASYTVLYTLVLAWEARHASCMHIGNGTPVKRLFNLSKLLCQGYFADAPGPRLDVSACFDPELVGSNCCRDTSSQGTVYTGELCLVRARSSSPRADGGAVWL